VADLPTRTRSTRSGPGRALVAVYGVFAVAASSRAGVQIASRFDDAPVAYALSAFSAVVYVVATVALARGGPYSRRVAWVACGIELVGVLTIGTLSIVDRAAFPDETVWSVFGQGYLFIPLVLPVLGLLWLRHTAGSGTKGSGSEGSGAEGSGAEGSGSKGSGDRTGLGAPSRSADQDR
jgi:hypothetical protein